MGALPAEERRQIVERRRAAASLARPVAVRPRLVLVSGRRWTAPPRSAVRNGWGTLLAVVALSGGAAVVWHTVPALSASLVEWLMPLAR